MNTKEEKAQGCDCETGMLKEVDGLVKEGTKPTKTEHDEKKAEVESAFNKAQK